MELKEFRKFFNLAQIEIIDFVFYYVFLCSHIIKLFAYYERNIIIY